MTIHDDIKALQSAVDNPWREFIENCLSGSTYLSARNYMQLLADLDRGYAALARLDLLRKWVEQSGHIYGSGGSCLHLIGQPCTCGRDALLAATEGPK